MPQPDVLLLNPADNVCVAMRNLAAGTSIAAGGSATALAEPIRQAHKIAIREIAAGQPIVKYGQTIGFATQKIAPGQWVHTHNLTPGEFARDYAKSTAVPADLTPITDRTFRGYRRADGRAGTRNYIAVISSVNCSATV